MHLITDNSLALYLSLVISEIRETGTYKNGLGKYQIRHEEMSPIFDKYHICGLGYDAVIHHLKEPDLGNPHDHPFGFKTFILEGWYTERIFQKDGSYADFLRKEGASHEVKATDIHRIFEMPKTGCFTLMIPGPWERKSGFWHFDENGAKFREWDQADFKEKV